MNCEQAKPLIDPYSDGELDASAIFELEKHLQSCSACGLQWRNLQSLKNAMKQDALYFTTPTELRRKLLTELQAQVETQPEHKLWNWLTLATTGAAAICFAMLLAITLTKPMEQQRLAQELVSSHIRSLITNHALDVASSDRHTVKPWFTGKLDFSPPVEDLAAQGFPLLGGRLDYINGHTIAALVIQSHKHIVNLFIWPSKDTEANLTVLAPMQGFNLVHWSARGMTFWAISDLNAKELLEFARTWAKAAPAPM
jgi:anti-sigma factor RsiW